MASDALAVLYVEWRDGIEASRLDQVSGSVQQKRPDILRREYRGKKFRGTQKPRKKNCRREGVSSPRP